MRWIVAVPLSIVGGLLALQTPIQAQTADTQLPVSLERIRAALREQPPVLRVAASSSDAVPTFQVEVQQRLSIQPPVDEQPFDLTWGLPSAGQLAMMGIGKIQTAVVNYKRGRAERRARKEVEDALSVFCATHECPAPTSEK
jgi:hypothetical protein